MELEPAGLMAKVGRFKPNIVSPCTIQVSASTLDIYWSFSRHPGTLHTHWLEFRHDNQLVSASRLSDRGQSVQTFSAAFTVAGTLCVGHLQSAEFQTGQDGGVIAGQYRGTVSVVLFTRKD